MLIGTTIYALINTAVLALMAIGFNLTFGISGIANFAYGAFYILAAYGVWMLLTLLHLPYPAAVAVAILVNLVLGALVYRFVLLRVRGQALSEVIATFGIGLAILELFRYFGLVGFEYNLPVFVDKSFVIAGTYVDFQRIAIVVFSAVLILALAVYIIGGLGSTGGVIAASFIVGFAERFTDTYIGSHWTMIVSLAAILIVLTIKPSGLFGNQKELEERI